MCTPRWSIGREAASRGRSASADKLVEDYGHSLQEKECVCCSVAPGGADPVFYRSISRTSGNDLLSDPAVLPPRTRQHHQNTQRNSALLM